jgi:hypothetical protein
VTDRDLLDAYRREDMSVWKTYVDTVHCTPSSLLYDYGYCGYIVSADKEAAKPYVERFKSKIQNLKSQMPAGHYEMYMSAVYVFELRLHESFHPVKAMSLAKEAASKAPHDPLTLSYYGTSLFYAPRPFGSKKEALLWFEKAQQYFRDPKWQDCWAREANEMYIRLCHEKYKL